ncbi:B3/B4 domain-containing protein [Fusibacter tunisiensis]|uniref:DNA/RNA-binding domain of Phe-tRNA-synthetase-like protein n=1 Tax=Fusibacter tunisiensis TaxID=1008308 RepID=A0ABS2MU12_9FIRM|nr:B3/4 domain-containing protein [Fusibacter tunisiensis]MBM7562840.1 DNA/RNA-binding domain of Phe-tRNA-synthetase-like protein [Fusibacter tunisiensis]
MKKFIVENDFWDLFPKSKIGVVVLNGIDNTIRDNSEYEQILKLAGKEAEKYFLEAVFSENEVIKVWREAFQKFKTKKGARSSIEALLKRVQKGDSIGTINPLVDIYNSISLKYGLPCGGEDIETFQGDVKLTKAFGDESFVTLGSDESAPPYKDEIIYKDDAGAICRCWNWRESVRTMLTEKTKDAFLCIELVDDTRQEILAAALEELAFLATKHLGGTYEISVVDINHREIDIM